MGEEPPRNRRKASAASAEKAKKRRTLDEAKAKATSSSSGEEDAAAKAEDVKPEPASAKPPPAAPVKEEKPARAARRAAPPALPVSLPLPVEMDFGAHVAHLESPLMTFEATVRALLNTLKRGADLSLPSTNMQSCAECHGGGELLLCDCCQFAFHVDCVDHLERGTYLYVPFAKYGLRANAPPTDSTKLPKLSDNEWFCPYCLSRPVQRYWKRGVPQFLSTFPGLGTEVEVEGNGVLGQWCDDVRKFMQEESEKVDSFPPNVLLAMTGIRRGIQRLGPTFQSETQIEVEKLKAANIIGDSEMDEDVAEPAAAGHDTTKPRASILQGVNLENSAANSDEAMSEGEARVAKPAARVSRRKRGAKTAIVPSPVEDGNDAAETARMNIGANFQIPGIHKFFTEALELGCDYTLANKHSVYAYLPTDDRGFVPQESLPAKSTCRMVYSVSELEKMQKQAYQTCGNNEQDLIENCTTPLTEDELNLYIIHVLSVWPAWLQWPPTQEYALKLLHHCRYDAKEALKLLCTDGMQFRQICDPPVRPYMNKWKPRDKRGFKLCENAEDVIGAERESWEYFLKLKYFSADLYIADMARLSDDDQLKVWEETCTRDFGVDFNYVVVDLGRIEPLPLLEPGRVGMRDKDQYLTIEKMHFGIDDSNFMWPLNFAPMPLCANSMDTIIHRVIIFKIVLGRSMTTSRGGNIGNPSAANTSASSLAASTLGYAGNAIPEHFDSIIYQTDLSYNDPDLSDVFRQISENEKPFFYNEKAHMKNKM